MQLRLLTLLLASVLGSYQPASGQEPSSRPAVEKLNLNKRSLAIEGYDPVAYFPEGGGAPAKGKEKLSVRHRGVVYRFASERNREAFLETPHRYEPAFGGWCAWAMADDDRVEVDPKSFLIQDGELLLFYDGFLADTRKKWSKGDPAELKLAAGGHWLRYFDANERDLSRWNAPEGIGAGGFDPILLRDPEQEPRAGDPAWAYTYRGITHRFISEANLARFREDPSAFEPRVGGWDPVKLAAGEWVAGDPHHAAIVAGRLFLFASEESRVASTAELLEAAEGAFRTGSPKTD